MKHLTRLGILQLLVLTGLTGCTGYAPLSRPSEPVPIAVLPIINESELPQIIAPISRNVHEGLAHSANWDLSSKENAEALIQITILSVTREAIARNPQDTGRPLSFHETVRLSVEWISELPAPWGPSSIVEIEGDQLLYAQPSLVDSETISMAGLSERLALKLLRRLDWSAGPQ